MERKGKGRGRLLSMILAAPVLTILLSFGGAKLILSEVLGKEQLPTLACAVVAAVTFLLSTVTALRAPQKRFLWGLAAAGAYALTLLLSNLLFFGEGYAGILTILCAVAGGGVLGSFLGGGKRRKKA